MSEGQVTVTGKTSLTFLGGMLVQIIAVVWWGATLNANQNNMAVQLGELKSQVASISSRSDPNPVQDQRIQANAQAITDLKADVAEMKNRVSALERR